MTKARDLANASTALSAVDATELGYLDGVTSAVQTQLNSKLASSTAATTYVANSLADAKGDIFVASADNTVTRLPVGSTGDTIVADSSTSTGLRYNPQNALANPFINGGFDIWQRGTSITATTSSYTADRWFNYRAVSGCTVSRQTVTDTTNLPNIQYAMRIQRDSGNTSTTVIGTSQSIENVNSTPFIGKTVTLSFYMRVGANYSGGNITVDLASGTGTDQNITINFTGYSIVASAVVTPTTTWTRYVATGTVSSSAKQLAMGFNFNPTGTAGANDWIEITGVQLDLGTYTASSAPTFRRAGGTIQGELAACQRYYWRQTASSPYQGLQPYANAKGTAQISGVVINPVPMRIAPTSLEFSTLGVYDGNTNVAVTSMTLAYAGTITSLVDWNVSSGLTANRSYCLAAYGSTSAYIGLSAEL